MAKHKKANKAGRPAKIPARILQALAQKKEYASTFKLYQVVGGSQRAVYQHIARMAECGIVQILPGPRGAHRVSLPQKKNNIKKRY